MMNKIKEHEFVKNQSRQPNLISFFDKATDTGEAENTSEAFCIFPPDSLEAAEKTPSKNNQSSNGRGTAPSEEGPRDEEVPPASSMSPEGLSPLPSIRPMGCLPKAKPSLRQLLASCAGLSLISPSHPHAYLSRNILMQHYPILTLDTGIRPRRCFGWSLGHSTWFGNGVNLHQQPMKPGCEHRGFAASLPVLRMDRRTDGLTDGDP